MEQLPLNSWDIISAVLGANLLTISLLYGCWRLNKYDEWDWYSIFAIGIPGLVLSVATYYGNQMGQF